MILEALDKNGLTGAEATVKLMANPLTGALVVEGGTGGGGAGTSDTTEATQLLVKTAVQAINTATGTVTASPTANTVLARLKDILSLTVLAAGSAIIGKVGIDQSTPGTTNAVSVTKTGAYSNVTTATLSNVAASATTVTVLAANANRLRAVIHNDSVSATLYIKFGATASLTSFTYKLAPDDTYESPSANVYTGVIDGIWSAATGSARITEMV